MGNNIVQGYACALALFAATTATTATATDARENEDEPHKVATIASAKTCSTTAVVEQEHKQDDIAWIAATSVCTTVCKESVHVMYLLFSWIAPTSPYASFENCVTVHLFNFFKIYICVDLLKRMIGIVVGVFCTLIVAGVCSYLFNLDLIWWNTLNKPSFVLSGSWFTAFVFASYVSSILSITRLVEHKHIFPSMIFFAVLGLFCALFVLAMFRLKNLWFALFCISVNLAMGYVLFVRFLTKDYKIAIAFLPTLAFLIYGFLCVISIVMIN